MLDFGEWYDMKLYCESDMLKWFFAVLAPLQASMAYPSVNTHAPGFASWDDASMMVNAASSKNMASQDEFANLQGAEGMLIFLFCLTFF